MCKYTVNPTDWTFNGATDHNCPNVTYLGGRWLCGAELSSRMATMTEKKKKISKTALNSNANYYYSTHCEAMHS